MQFALQSTHTEIDAHSNRSIDSKTTFVPTSPANCSIRKKSGSTRSWWRPQNATSVMSTVPSTYFGCSQHCRCVNSSLLGPLCFCIVRGIWNVRHRSRLGGIRTCHAGCPRTDPPQQTTDRGQREVSPGCSQVFIAERGPTLPGRGVCWCLSGWG
jgi:hypothetical protein